MKSNIENQIEENAEQSAGAIVFRKTDFGSMEVLLIQHFYSSHWAFPKGHLELHETEECAAIREVQEETGIHIKIECDFRQQVFYNINKKIKKYVTYFLAVDRQNQIIRNCDSKVKSVIWKNIDHVHDKLGFDNDKNVFDNAVKYAKEHKELF